MIKKLLIFASLFVVFVFGAFASESRVAAQDVIAGGYADASVRDKDVRKAANFAVKQRSKNVKRTFTLVSIRKAEVQVVAGLNYRVCLRVRDNRGRTSTVTTVVYKNLKNKLSLTRWRSGGCSDI